MGLFSLVQERLEVVNYTQFLGSDTFTILMKNIERVSKVESIIAPFHKHVSMHFYLALASQNLRCVVDKVWICILLAIVSMGPLIYILTAVQPHQKMSVWQIYWYIIGALLRQGSTLDPKKGKILVSTAVIKHVN